MAAAAVDGGAIAAAGGDDGTYFACRKCRAKLFEPSDVKEHKSQQHTFSYKRRAKDSRKGKVSNDCSSYFLESPMDWMDTTEVEGKLWCPKCTARIGTLKWAGGQCSCGTWVTPSIQVSMAKVEPRSTRPVAVLGIVKPPEFVDASVPDTRGDKTEAGAPAISDRVDEVPDSSAAPHDHDEKERDA